MDIDIITTDIGYAKQLYLQKLDAILTKMKSGCGDTKSIQPLKRIIKALQWRLDADINDNTTSRLYACMMKIIGSFGSPYTVDPSVYQPNTTVIVLDMALDLPYNETDLVSDGTGGFYLPFYDKSKPTPYPPVPINYRPTVVINNGESFTETWSKNFIPWRLYGFGNNTDSQTIIVTIVKT